MKKEVFLKILRLISINVALLVLLLVLADPFLAKNEENDIKVARSLRLREFGPNRSMWVNPAGHNVDTSLLDSKTYFLKTDVNGFIMGPDDDSTALPEIVFFGGSTTECIFVDDSLRFPYLVSKAILNNMGRANVCRNYGFGGNHSFHSFVNLLGTGLRVKPKMVVLMHNINDLNLLNRTGSYYAAPANRQFYVEEKKASNTSLKSRLKQMIWATAQALIPNLSRRLQNLNQQKSSQADEWEGFRNMPLVSFRDVENQFKASLQSFVSVAKANSIEVVLMTQFNCFSASNENQKAVYEKANPGKSFAEFLVQYRRFNEVIRETALETGTKLIDLDVLMPKDTKLYYDGVHLNNAGSKLAARSIYDALQAKSDE